MFAKIAFISAILLPAVMAEFIHNDEFNIKNFTMLRKQPGGLHYIPIYIVIRTYRAIDVYIATFI